MTTKRSIPNSYFTSKNFCINANDYIIIVQALSKLAFVLLINGRNFNWAVNADKKFA